MRRTVRRPKVSAKPRSDTSNCGANWLISIWAGLYTQLPLVTSLFVPTKQASMARNALYSRWWCGCETTRNPTGVLAARGADGREGAGEDVDARTIVRDWQRGR